MRFFPKMGGVPIASTVLLGCLGFFQAAIAAAPDYQIVQSAGADQRVNYAELSKFGPWDDRNYALTKADLSFLSDNEEQLTDPIPAFFRVMLRKNAPLRTSGPAQYPRAAVPLFYRNHYGLLRNGAYVDRDGQARGTVPVNAEGALDANGDDGDFGNEFTVEINPTDSNIAIAGGNVGPGQRMYRSTDGGASWEVTVDLPSTCCDPTVEWSSNGQTAYAASLGSFGGAIGVSFWRSEDMGQSWINRIDLTTGGSDKEWLHVDKSSTSPHIDNIYLTYHNSNTMQFARSTDGGFSFDITAFGSAPSGIGSDITTDTAGNIYYFYGAFGDQTIEMLKSTDGGETFDSSSAIAATNGSFDWPIPAMESRNAWIYASADTDRSGGPFNNTIYVAWTDLTAPASTTTNNHTVINVARSSDGGATWTISNPHPMTDTNTVDRFNQWLTVSENGTVHVVYYDTRNSTNRTGVDLYYAYSTDGAQSWSEPARLSSDTSDNISNGQEWGDYNGISVVEDKVVAIWTDNRAGQFGYGAQAQNLTAEPGFLLSVSPTNQAVCAPADLQDVDVQVNSLLEFVNPITLSLDLPAGFSGGLDNGLVTPPASTTASVAVDGTVSTGIYQLSVDGTATDAADRSTTINVSVFAETPDAPGLAAPSNGAMLSGTAASLTWNSVAGAAQYLVEVATDADFVDVVGSETTAATTATINGLNTETQYFWRVTPNNLCGDGAVSTVFSFTTGLTICAIGPVSIPDNGGPADAAELELIAAAGGTIEDLDVSIKATHTYIGDLIFSLTHVETGTTVVLIDRPGYTGSGFGCSSNNVDVVMNDASDLPVEDECASGPALGGILQPQQALAAFNGDSVGGQWILTVSDNAGIDTGTVDEWCLLPTVGSNVIDIDEDGINDSQDNCLGVSNPLQIDSNGDNIGNACDADLTGDCLVNLDDLGGLRTAFFSTPGDSNWNPDADFTGPAGIPDGVVNLDDLGVMRDQFFGPPGPSARGCDNDPKRR